MKKMYAQMTAHSSDEMIMQVDPVTYGDAMYYGCQRVFLKQETKKDEQGEDRIIQVVDSSKPVKYDNITQSFKDIENMQSSSAQMLSASAKGAMRDYNIQQQQAQMLANSAKTQIENKNLKQQQAMLLSQMAKMTMKGSN